MNLWMWDGRLPFVGYQENNTHMMVLQLIHIVLIVSELLILMLLGKMMARLRFSKVRVISSWLLMVTVGVLADLVRSVLEEELSIQQFFGCRDADHAQRHAVSDRFHFRRGSQSLAD